MSKLVTISFRNFLSYGNQLTTISLDRPGEITLIEGINHDMAAMGKASNGVGKSTILNAISVGCFDEAISSISKSQMINHHNDKNMEVILTFVGVDKQTYTVHRYRKLKSPTANGTGVNLFKGDLAGEDITPDSVDATNKKVEQLLGFTFEVFKRVVMYSASHEPFLRLKADKQKLFIEELFGLVELSSKAGVLKSLIDENKKAFSIEQVRVEGYVRGKTQAEVVLDRIKLQSVEWQAKHDAKLIQLKKDLDQAVPSQYTEEFLNQQRILHAAVGKLKNDMLQLSQSLQHLTNKLSDAERKRTAVEREIEKLEQHTCPFCEQHMPDVGVKLDAKRTELVAIDELIKDSESKRTTIEEELLQINDDVCAIKKDIVVTDVDAEFAVLRRSAVMQSQLESAKLETNPFEKGIEAAEQDLARAIDQVDYTELNKLEKTIEHQTFLHKLLTRKDSFVRKELMSERLPYLNKRLDAYLTDIGLPHRVRFTSDLDAEIIAFGGKHMAFDQLSEGQKARVNFALSLAFRDVLIRPELSKGDALINIFMLDEVLDRGLENLGIQNVSNLIKKKTKEENLSTYLISHREEVSNMFSKKILIEMKNEMSFIAEESQ